MQRFNHYASACAIIIATIGQTVGDSAEPRRVQPSEARTLVVDLVRCTMDNVHMDEKVSALLADWGPPDTSSGGMRDDGVQEEQLNYYRFHMTIVTLNGDLKAFELPVVERSAEMSVVQQIISPSIQRGDTGKDVVRKMGAPTAILNHGETYVYARDRCCVTVKVGDQNGGVRAVSAFSKESLGDKGIVAPEVAIECGEDVEDLPAPK